MNRFYYDHLAITEQRYYEKVLRALEHRESSISPGLMIYDESFEKVLRAINYDHPELFYVDFQRLAYMKTPLGVSYNPNYSYRSAVLGMMSSQLDSIAASILQAARAAGVKTPYEHLRWIHNYLVKNVKYNYEAVRHPDMYPDAFNCFGALINKQAVCEGISKAFKFLCDKAGLDVFIVSGESCFANTNQMMAHAWNCAIVDQCHTHIDVTWDINMSETAKANRYDYFCIPDSDISIDHVYSGYPTCNTNGLSYFAQTGKMFSGVKQLKEYLTKELSKNGKVLYFKVISSPTAPADLHNKIQSLVEKMIGQHCTSSYSYQMSHNLKHNIFYYKIF